MTASSDISQCWSVLPVRNDSILELRALWPLGIPGVRRRTSVKHFHSKDFASAAELKAAFEAAATQLNESGYNVYSLFNRIAQVEPGNAAKDGDIAKVDYVLIDIDRTSDTKRPATNEEVAYAAALGKDIRAFLSENGFPNPIAMMSGNGIHMLYPLDTEDVDRAKTVIREFLYLIARKFDNDQVCVDKGVYNPSRIWKLPGSYARKGEETDDRPYRKATIIQCEKPKPISLEMLKKVTDLESEASVEKSQPPANGCISPQLERVSGAISGNHSHLETADNVALVKAMLQSVSADTDYESYRQIVWSVKSLGWNCAPELLVEWSMTSPDHWTEEKAGHSQSTLDSLINSFDPLRGVSIGTLIHVARQNGYSGRVLGQLEENIFSEVAQNDVVEHTILDKLRGFSLRGDSQQLQQQLEDDVFVMNGIAILGQWTVIYAAPNCEKSLLAIWHLAESIKLGAVQASKIFYVNADDTFRGMTEKLLFAERHGFEMLVPGHKGFEASMVLEIMNRLVDAGAASGVVLVLDTLKKFTDLMDKRVASKFGVLARKFTAAGGTLVCLAHTNKHKDAEGNSVYSGTSDIADDCDCVYILERVTNESGLVDVYSVEGRNEKSRGDVSKKVGFTYTRRVGDSYEQLLASVERQDGSEIESIKRAREVSAGLIADKEIIEAVIESLNGGETTKDKLVKSVNKATGQPQPRVREVINARDGTDYMSGHRWTHCKGDNNAQVFSVLHPLVTKQPE